MKKATVVACACACTFTFVNAQAALYFEDDFIAADGTALSGHSPSIGGTWSGSTYEINNDSLDTSSGSGSAFASLTSALSTDTTLVLTFNTLIPSSGKFLDSTGWAGVSLYVGGSSGTEVFFLGDPGGGVNATIGMAVIPPGGSSATYFTNDTTVVNTLTFSYEYNTGNWSLTTLNDELSGTTSANLAIDTIRIASDSAADIHLSGLSTTVTAVPEPSTCALSLGTIMLGLGLIRRRRRQV